MKLCENRVGEVNYTNTGQKMVIIAYRDNKDLDVQLDDGTILRGIRYTSFKKGNTLSLLRKNRVGEVSYTSDGQKMEIITYRGYDDIDIQFEDGYIAYHKRYTNFKAGKIANKGAKVGEINYNSKGQRMTIIRYSNCTDLDVQFDDGTIIEHRTYTNFILGNIPNPITRVGETSVTISGVVVKIVEYISCNNILVRFEDGIESSSTYATFNKRQIAHPTLRMSGNGVCKGATFGLFDIKKFMYRTGNQRDVNYLCVCKKCGYKDILNPSEMLKHKCLK